LFFIAFVFGLIVWGFSSIASYDFEFAECLSFGALISGFL